MKTLLLKHATLLVSMDDNGTTWNDGGIYVEDNVIRQIGPTPELPQEADTIIDASDMIVLPGLVNTHHHFYQTLTRCIPEAQNATLFHWLRTLYPIWARLTPQAIAVSTRTAIAELMLSGCTTTSDHTYIWPNGSRIDDQIEAAQTMRIRFHATRGSMSVGESKGGLPPDSVVEDEETILRDSRRVIEEYHDSSRYSMLRIALAPCSPFSVSPDLMRESIALARSYGVQAHTHLAETLDEAEYCKQHFGRSPVELMEDLGWLGGDVWHAHTVHLSSTEIEQLGKTRTGAAHCPSSNMRLASGIAPVMQLQQAGARVGLGVDGSASNDSSHLLAEARQAMLLQRVMGNPGAMTASQALWMATRGGASVLGRDDIGYLAPDMAADFIGFRLNTLELSGGAVHDAPASLIFCHPPHVDLSVINGMVCVLNKELIHADLTELVQEQNRVAWALVRDELR
ncbi:cytosine/adenosine deaminase-related metal-dependent hydrolase [Thermosporothrix hazakensis]|jgi:cytosine/adenosine deaminase-related metal-dependent hydrolase|uniref:Cytosine/adenosine deaminase-related metal-dependent hydrolase n=3 Tax=Thermosporothrix TaxID=768650 RepID=A0A326U5U7_THEHA|nr:8-oxoguanine deaminase [Thermosporothrix hazakensis]PZW29321.1 cytosine/adenosine deaminase-related metal-dependent hydrolase [Thermosporothrix hazakensis]BBH86250.1 8-oxoguanine deaminase [Thermosporothrix sp. COM3]GCE45328.1 8-oxoguanine deaminase [Thermosporothrix hazakensis]